VTGIVSARMLAGLGAFYPATCKVEQVTASTQGETGEPTETWGTLAGHGALACRIAPAGEREVRALGLMIEATTHVIALAGRYASITPAMRAVVDGVTYDITEVRGDGEGVTTYLGVKVVRT
jgi:head-tail adaptor